MLAIRLEDDLVLQCVRGGSLVLYNPVKDCLHSARPFNPLGSTHPIELLKSRSVASPLHCFVTGRRSVVVAHLNNSGVYQWAANRFKCIQVPKSRSVMCCAPSPFIPQGCAVLLDSGDLCVNAFLADGEGPFQRSIHKCETTSIVSRCIFGSNPSVIVGGTSSTFVTIDTRAPGSSSETEAHHHKLDVDMAFMERCTANGFMSIHNRHCYLWDDRMLERRVTDFSHMLLRDPVGWDFNGTSVAIWSEDPDDVVVFELLKNWSFPVFFRNSLPEVNVPIEVEVASETSLDSAYMFENNSDQGNQDALTDTVTALRPLSSDDPSSRAFSSFKYVQRLAPIETDTNVGGFLSVDGFSLLQPSGSLIHHKVDFKTGAVFVQ